MRNLEDPKDRIIEDFKQEKNQLKSAQKQMKRLDYSILYIPKSFFNKLKLQTCKLICILFKKNISKSLEVIRK